MGKEGFHSTYRRAEGKGLVMNDSKYHWAGGAYFTTTLLTTTLLLLLLLLIVLDLVFQCAVI
jgi:hypothetical protein